MNNKIIHSLTAYQCRVCKKYGIENLLLKDNAGEDYVNLRELLDEFFDYIKICKIDKYTNRAIMLSVDAVAETIEDSITRIYIEPNAGKALENFSVVNHNTNKLNRYKGEDNSAVYNHNVYFYLSENKNIFVFHRYGQSGCKTAFLNTFNEFLSSKGLMAHLDVLMSDKMFDVYTHHEPEKISLITTYSDVSSDKADNIKNKVKKKIEQETIITLNSPRAQNLKGWLRGVTQNTPTIDELKQVLIKDNFSNDFEDAKITVKFGKVRRRISLSEFSGMMAEYDITEKITILADGSVYTETLTKVADEYALSFFNKE